VRKSDPLSFRCEQMPHFLEEVANIFVPEEGHRVNMELDLQSLFGLHAQLYSLAGTPQPAPRIWAHSVYQGAIGQPR
jgi:hypothetical protein